MEEGITENSERNTQNLDKKPTTNAIQISRQVRESNPGHIGGRRALRVSQGFWGTREHWQNIAGNKGTLANFWQQGNKIRKNYSTKTFGKCVGTWEHRAILEGNKGTRTPLETISSLTPAPSLLNNNNDKLNPDITPGRGIEPWPHWWEASSLAPAPNLVKGERAWKRGCPAPSLLNNNSKLYSLIYTWYNCSGPQIAKLI